MILSVDPGSSKIGWAIVDLDETIVSLGSIGPGKGLGNNIPFNLKMNHIIKSLLDFYEDLLDNRDITNVAWEIVPSFGAMAQRELVQASATTLKVLTFQRGLPYQQFTPRSWHKDFMGVAKVTKEEVKQKVLEWPKTANPLPTDAPYDTYDAIAIGLTAARKNVWITDEF